MTGEERRQTGYEAALCVQNCGEEARLHSLDFSPIRLLLRWCNHYCVAKGQSPLSLLLPEEQSCYQIWNYTHCVPTRASARVNRTALGEARPWVSCQLAGSHEARTRAGRRTVKRWARRGPGLYARLLMFMKKYMQSTRFSSSSGSSSSCDHTLCF